MPYSQVPFQRLGFKASHNSYERDEDIHEQLAWSPAAPGEGGCRGIEIDITRHSDQSLGRSVTYFQVSHDKGGEGISLAAYLGYLLSYHANAPSHEPIFVTLDIKSEEGAIAPFPHEIDGYLTEWFDASLIFRPRDLIRNRARDLLTNVVCSGWPTLQQLLGKFIFCLSGTEAWKTFYAAFQPLQSICFSDSDVDDRDPKASAPTSGNVVIFNFELSNANYQVWQATVPRFTSSNLIVRGYVLNSSSSWTHARATKVNILSTDQVRGRAWAHVGSEPFIAY